MAARRNGAEPARLITVYCMLPATLLAALMPPLLLLSAAEAAEEAPKVGALEVDMAAQIDPIRAVIRLITYRSLWI